MGVVSQLPWPLLIFFFVDKFWWIHSVPSKAQRMFWLMSSDSIFTSPFSQSFWFQTLLGSKGETTYLFSLQMQYFLVWRKTTNLLYSSTYTPITLSLYRTKWSVSEPKDAEQMNWFHLTDLPSGMMSSHLLLQIWDYLIVFGRRLETIKITKPFIWMVFSSVDHWMGLCC